MKKTAKTVIQKAYDPLEVGLPSVVWIEQLILGMAIMRQCHMDELAPVVLLEDFSTEAHRLIWAACSTLHAQSTPVTPHSVATELHQHGQLEMVSPSYISEICTTLTVETLQKPSRFVTKLRDYGQRRQAIFKANEIMIDASSPGCESATLLLNASESYARMAADLSPDSGFKSPSEILKSMGGINKYAFEQFSETVIRTPIAQLNATLVAGGFVPGDLVIIAGHTSRGKSTLAVNFALYAGQQGKRVVFVSLEMPEESIYDKLVSLTGNIDGYMLHRQHPHSMAESQRRDDIRDSLNYVNELPIKINFRPGISPKVLLGELRRIQATDGIDLLIVDYLQLMSGGEKFGNRTEEVSHISRSLKRIAGELNIPVIALSQFSRESAKQEREPRLDDLRESGSIEQDCTVAILLHVTRMWDIPAGIKTADVKAILAKQRNGISATWIPLEWNVPTGRFYEPGSNQEMRS